MSQLTLDGGIIALPKMTPSKDLTPAELIIYNYLRGAGPRTEKQIHLHPITAKFTTTGNKLRSMRKKGYLDNLTQRDKPQLWRAK